MRIKLIGVSSLLFAPNAHGQLYYCNRPSEPYIRSGYSADLDQMERTKREVNDYVDEMQTYLTCLKNEHSDASHKVNDVIDDWNRAVRSFNNK
ncbi:hypothetical protein BJF95_06785 [Rhizobium oryziradicis]|uniref:Uncharacterized protein n=1 Tax=Rhizobium oryziradicis TaxID=1867956 RepID=A0A1Q8ZQA3_9HYPH|nr:hypothetical protein BJF95_06785 [Rhizobium oryziradicis]